MGKINWFGNAGKKKKKGAVPQEFIEQVAKMNPTDLVKSYIHEQNDIKALDELRKNDEKITDLTNQIKERQEEVEEQVQALKEKIKELQSNPEIDELKEDRKALVKGYNDEKKRRKAYRDYLYETMQKVF